MFKPRRAGSAQAFNAGSAERLPELSALLCFHELDEACQPLVDLAKLKRGELCRVGNSFFGALGLLMPDQGHEVFAEKIVVSRAYVAVAVFIQEILR